MPWSARQGSGHRQGEYPHLRVHLTLSKPSLSSLQQLEERGRIEPILESRQWRLGVKGLTQGAADYFLPPGGFLAEWTWGEDFISRGNGWSKTLKGRRPGPSVQGCRMGLRGWLKIRKQKASSDPSMVWTIVSHWRCSSKGQEGENLRMTWAYLVYKGVRKEQGKEWIIFLHKYIQILQKMFFC